MTHQLLRNCLAVFFVTLFSIPISLAQSVKYRFDFSNRAHREAKVSIKIPEVKKNEPLRLRMSRSSAGRYALHEFAKNVYAVNAFDKEGKKLEVIRTSPSTWEVRSPSDEMSVQYTLFADYADGTYSGINNVQAHLNAPATYLLVDNFYDDNFEQNDLSKKLIEVIFSLPKESWSVATQLPKINDSTFYAPHYYYLLDSPVLIGDLHWNEWAEKGQNYRVALHHFGTAEEADTFTKKIKKIVSEEIALFGEAPQFDYGAYTFLLNYQPTAHGDGMEHRNSTIITQDSGLDDGHLFTIAHEFIHAWNIERLRPSDLEPFDFSAANMSDALWFGEGFTSYYTYLIMRRAGLIDDVRFAQMMGGILNYVLVSPGYKYHSPVQMSQQAPFADAATANDPLSHHNTFTTYYYYGAVIGLALDMELRQNYNSSLDEYMRLAWREFGEVETPYTLPDLEDLLAALTKDKAFAQNFFEKHIYGNQLPDFENLLKTVAMDWTPIQPNRVWLGKLALQTENGQAIVDNYTLLGTPIYEAGVDKGDVLMKVGDYEIKSMEDYRAAVQKLQNIDELAVITFGRIAPDGLETITKEVTWQSFPYHNMILLDTETKGVTSEQVKEREKWFSSQVR